jgi:hypothetical protein
LQSPENDSHRKTSTSSRTIKRVARTLVKDLPPEPLVEQALKNAIRDIPEAQLAWHKLEHHLEESIRQAVEDAVSQAVKETVEAEVRA